MMKKILIAAALLTPLVVFADEVDPAAASAAAEAAKVTKVNNQKRASVSLACQQQARLLKLAGAEQKKFLVTCINPDAKPAPDVAK
jgi:hypothetical protein